MWIMFKSRKSKFMFHTKRSSLSVDCLAIVNMSTRGEKWRPRSLAITPYPRWVAEPGVHCQTTVLQWVKLHTLAGKAGRTLDWNPAGLPSCFFSVQRLAKVTFVTFITSSHTSCMRHMGQQQNTASTNYGCPVQTSWPRRDKEPDLAQSEYCLLYHGKGGYRKTCSLLFCGELEEDWFWSTLTYWRKAFSKWLAGQQ